jgi:hypothetical protein
MVLSSRSLSACLQSKCQPSYQLVNTTTRLKDLRANTRYFPYCNVLCFIGLKLFCLCIYLLSFQKLPKSLGSLYDLQIINDVLTFKILKNGLSIVLHRSVVRSTADHKHRNERVTLNPDVQETLDKLDTIPVSVRPSDNQPKHGSRRPNDEVCNRTRSTTGCIDQNVGDRTRSKVHAMSFSRIHGNFFPLYDEIKFEDNKKVPGVNLQ